MGLRDKICMVDTSGEMDGNSQNPSFFSVRVSKALVIRLIKSSSYAFVWIECTVVTGRAM